MKIDPPEAENYLPGRSLADGGMGSVLEAEDRKLGRRVALKTMALEAYADPALRKRFIREALVLAKLAHPNIVPIYDIVWDEDVPQFYAMKLVQGKSLHEILTGIQQGDVQISGEHTLERLLTIFVKVCDAVAFAHSQGVVHRDLKPDNVMVGEFGEVLVMDWGLAGLEGDELPVLTLEKRDPLTTGADTADLTLTMNGSVMGTPRYMSPEQAQGRVEEIDALSDIYSLGGILHAILTLQPPVDGDTVHEVLEKISHGSIRPPSEFGQSQARPHDALPHCPGGRIPKGLSAVVMKAMALDREQRYQGVTELAADIVASQTGFSTSAENIGAFGELLLLMKRHRVVAASLLTIVVLTVGFILKVMAAAESERRTAYSAELAQALAARERHDLGQARQLLEHIDPDLRGFDWRLLQGLCRGDEQYSFPLGPGPGNEPQCLALLPGKDQIALISAHGHLHLLDLQGNALGPARALPPLTDPGLERRRYNGLTFSPNAGKLAYTNGDVLQVLDASTLALLYEETSRRPQLGWLDNERLLYGFNGSESAPPFPEAGAWILDFTGIHGAGEEIPRISFPQMCAPLAVSPDRRFFVLHRVEVAPWSWARALHVYQTDGDLTAIPEPIYNMPGQEYPKNLAFSVTGRFLAFSATTALKQSVRVLEVATESVLFDNEFRFPIHGLAIDPEARRLGLVGDDSVVRIYDFTRGNPRGQNGNTYDDAVEPLRCQPVDGRGASAPPRELLTRSAQDGRAQFFFGHEKRILDLAFAADGTLFTASGDGKICRWPAGHADPGLRIGYLDSSYALSHPTASADGKYLLFSVGFDTWWCDVALSRIGPEPVLRRVAGRHSPLAVLRGGRPVTLDLIAGDVVIWREEAGKFQEQTRIPGQVRFAHHGPGREGVLSRDEKHLVGTLAGQFFSADLEKGSMIWSGALGTGPTAYASLALSPDGQWIASTDFGPRASIHRFAEPEKIVAWLESAPRDEDTAVAFSRDGRLLYVGNEDGHVRVWSTVTWKERRGLAWPAHLSAVTAIAVSRDETLIATSGDDTLKLFALHAGKKPPLERLSFQREQGANWIQFAGDDRDADADALLLHSIPGRALESWEAGPKAARAETAHPTATPEPLLLWNRAVALLPDGKVLVSGGESAPAEVWHVPVSTCHLYDPASGSWSLTGSMRSRRSLPLGAHRLADGKVLIIGGEGHGGAPLTRCELYDPATGNWSETGSLAEPHGAGATVLLQNGKVLVAGGQDAEGACELYDPQTGAWMPTGEMGEPRWNAACTLMQDGKVLAVGGNDESGSGSELGCELYDPQSGRWRPTGSTVFPHLELASLSTLPGGEVLLAGGSEPNGVSARCEVFDPKTETWRAVDSLPEPRTGHTVTVLPDGQALLVGGYTSNGRGYVFPDQSLLFDPSTGSWSPAPGPGVAVFSHTTTLLENGSLLIVGGHRFELRTSNISSNVELRTSNIEHRRIEK